MPDAEVTVSEQRNSDETIPRENWTRATSSIVKEKVSSLFDMSLASQNVSRLRQKN